MQYIVTAEQDIQRRIFGIAAMENGQQLDWLPDVLPSFQETVDLAEWLTENGVSILHFRDVVSDRIAER